MYSLNTIHKINAERCKAPSAESTHDRHCSYCVSVNNGKRGIVLHSAKNRSTAYIEGAAATRFLVEIQSTNAFEKRDSIIERYFSAVPTGKQRVA